MFENLHPEMDRLTVYETAWANSMRVLVPYDRVHGAEAHTWSIRCSPRILWVQIISGVSESATRLAAKAAGPLLSRTYSRDSGNRPPSTLRLARGRDEETAASAPPWKACCACVDAKRFATESKFEPP